MKKLYVLLFFFSLLLGTNAMAQTIRYVKVGGTGNGSSWGTASGDLQAMINTSNANDEVWVAAGVYKPNRRANAVATITLNDRYNAFVLKANVGVYGGFAGTESTRTTRDFTGNQTILSGNIGDETIDTDNAYHVVVASGELGTARLDGFTITKGYTNGAGSGTSVSVTVNGNAIPATRAPGIINYYSSAAYENLILTENVNASDDQSAGAIYILYGSPTYTKVKFINNRTVSTSGGAMFIFSATTNPSKPVFTDVDFIGNQGSAGGAVVLSAASTATFVRCNFSGNKAITTLAGALYMFSASASAIVTDCTFTNNEAATSGGALYNSLATTVNISGSNFTNNIAKDGTGGGIYFSAGKFSLVGSTFTGNKSLTGSSGAVYLGTSTNLNTIQGNTFKNNEAATTGGAIYVSSTSPNMVNNRFYSNIAKTNGGALFLYGTSSAAQGSPIITGSIFYNNQSNSTTTGGGAIYVSTNSSASISNSTFYANKATAHGGAIYLGNNASVAPLLHNSILYGNTATLSSGDIYDSPDGTIVVRNSITQEYGSDGQNGNLVGINPEFDSEDESSADFLQLQSISQAVNAGSNELVPSVATVDLFGNPRIAHAVVDMGALEYSGILADPLKAYIDENTETGTFVATPISTLPGTITWSIFTGNTNNAFAINSSTGEITVNNTAALNYEAKKLFSLRLKAVNQLNDDENVYVLVYINNLMEDPGTPVIANVLNGILTSYRPKLSGVAEPSSNVTLYVDDVVYSASIQTNEQGIWNFTFDSDLKPGMHTFYIVTSSNLGTSNASESVSTTLKLYTGQIIVNNILTPNGDGRNDLWIITDLQLMYPKNEVIVYDKAGKIVFRKSNYQNDWDGTFNSSPLNNGTYYYEVNIGAGLKPMKGSLTILRGR